MPNRRSGEESEFERPGREESYRHSKVKFMESGGLCQFWGADFEVRCYASNSWSFSFVLALHALTFQKLFDWTKMI